MKATPQVLKGTRDFLPQRMVLRHYVIDQVRSVFERFGFEPLQTPAVEYAETLKGKYGDEADKLIYDFQDRGGREVGLRYDLTVPLARVVSMYPDLVKPFKRYQIAPVWRAERPQKGRYREFYQCDVDVIGCASMLADAEVLTVAYSALRQLGFTRFRVLLNNRKILQAVANQAQVPEDLSLATWRIVDKWDKIGPTGVRSELEKVGLFPDTIERLFHLLDLNGDPRMILRTLGERLGGEAVGLEGIAELNAVLTYLSLNGVPEEFFRVDLHMVRGLDYYTGPIYEVVVDEPKIGSITSGGRYDNLVGLLGATPYPAVGISLGLERLIDVIDELGMAPPNLGTTVTDVLVTVFDAELLPRSLEVAASLREAGLNTEVYLGAEKLGAQLKYAGRKGIPRVVILGPEEVGGGAAVLRDMVSGQQQRLPLSDLVAGIRSGRAGPT